MYGKRLVSSLCLVSQGDLKRKHCFTFDMNMDHIIWILHQFFLGNVRCPIATLGDPFVLHRIPKMSYALQVNYATRTPKWIRE